MEQLIEKKITVLIPKSNELEFDMAIKEFKNIYLNGVEMEIDSNCKSLIFTLVSNKSL